MAKNKYTKSKTKRFIIFRKLHFRAFVKRIVFINVSIVTFLQTQETRVVVTEKRKRGRFQEERYTVGGDKADTAVLWTKFYPYSGPYYRVKSYSKAILPGFSAPQKKEVHLSNNG